MDSVDKVEVKEVVACPHIPMQNNPLMSTTPNIVLSWPTNQGVGDGKRYCVYLVVEESKIKLICSRCLPLSLTGSS